MIKNLLEVSRNWV